MKSEFEIYWAGIVKENHVWTSLQVPEQELQRL